MTVGIRGYNENPGNERADILANKGIDQMRSRQKRPVEFFNPLFYIIFI